MLLTRRKAAALARPWATQTLRQILTNVPMRCFSVQPPFIHEPAYLSNHLTRLTRIIRSQRSRLMTHQGVC